MTSGGAGSVFVSGCAVSDRGRVREENQDRLLVLDLGEQGAPGLELPTSPDGPSGVPGPFRFDLRDEGAVLLVADGMGGRAGGSRASEVAIATVREELVARAADGGATSLASSLRRMLEVANQAIRDDAARDDRHRGMGTTATLAALVGTSVYLAQVGDSRAYLFRGTSVVRLTRDQSLAQDMIDSGVMSEEDARALNDNKILQALGPAARVLPDVTYHELREGDRLLLCSDGLFRVVRDEEIAAVLQRAEDESAACAELVRLANERGGPDNVTVVLARVAGDGLRRSSPEDFLGRRAYVGSEGADGTGARGDARP